MDADLLAADWALVGVCVDAVVGLREGGDVLQRGTGLADMDDEYLRQSLEAGNGYLNPVMEWGLEGQCYGVTYVSESVHGAASSEGLADALSVPCQAAAGEATGALGCWGSCGEGSEGREGGGDAEHCE